MPFMPEQNQQIRTQEVFALRKSGKLEEALMHGRRLYAQDRCEPWAIRALFWCLYDEVKRLQTGDDAEALAATKMELAGLALPNEENDRMMHDCASLILGSEPCAKASELSKAGEHHAAVALLRPIAKAKGSNARIAEAYGWVLYRKLKACTAEDPIAPVWCLNEFLNCWSSEWPPNAMLFKCLLIQAKIHAENWAGLTALVEKLGLHRLKPADFMDDRPDADYEPFQDQLLTAIHKSLKKHPDLHGERPALLQLLAAWQDSFGEGKFGHYHLGRILLWTGGDTYQARVLLLNAVQENPDEYWRWQAFAEALSGNEAKAAISRGICCACEDNSFKVPLYRAYADLLANEGNLSAAKASLAEAMRLRRLAGNEWTAPIPFWFEQVPAEAELDIHAYAEPFAEEADDLLISDIPDRRCVLMRSLQKENRFLYYCVAVGTRTLKFRQNHTPPPGVEAIAAKFMDQPDSVCKVLTWQAADLPDGIVEPEIAVVTHVNVDKQLTAVTTATQDFLPLFFDRWPGTSSLEPGTCLELRFLTDNERKKTLLNWIKVPAIPIPGRLMPIHGIFQLAHGKPFGFVEMAGNRVFVAPNEAQELVDSSEVHGWAIRSQDKQGRLTWKLLSLPSQCL